MQENSDFEPLESWKSVSSSNNWAWTVTNSDFSPDVVRLSTHQLQLPNSHAKPFLATQASEQTESGNNEAANGDKRSSFSAGDQHRLTLNKDILAATLILARASVLTSAERERGEEEEKSLSGSEMFAVDFKQVFRVNTDKISRISSADNLTAIVTWQVKTADLKQTFKHLELH